MSSIIVFAIAVIAPTFLVMGVLALLGKFDNFLLKKAAKSGETINLARARKVFGLSLICDSILLPAILLAVVYFCE